MVRRISRPRRSHRPPSYTFTPWEFQIPYESFEIPVDGETIDAWLLAQQNDDAPCIVCLSGFASHKAELLGIGSNLFRSGFTVLLIDFRGTGRSRGDILTMGHNETDDARASIDWLASRFPNAPIGMIGYSLGGSVALMVTATDQRVRAVVSDSGFATQRSVLAHHVRRRTGLWPTPILAVAAPMFRRRHRRHYDDFAPAALVHQIAPRPLLLIHPKDDHIVPFSHAEEIWQNALEPKVCWFPEGIGHCGAYFHDRAGYCRRIAEFFQATLRPEEQPVTATARKSPAET